jgi:hypothetical protein
MFWVLLLDSVALFSTRWAYADGPDLSFALHEIGNLGSLIILPGYFAAEALGVTDDSLRYLVMFVGAYIAWILISLVISRCWSAIRPVSPL